MPKFSADDVRAYMGLIRLMIGLDKRFSPGEAEHLARLATEIGEDEFWEHMQRSYDSETSREDIWKLAAGIEDREVQETIYGNLYELSIAGGIDADEEHLLDELQQLWGLEVTQADPDA